MGVHFSVFYFYLIIYQYLNYFFESCRGYHASNKIIWLEICHWDFADSGVQ